MDIRVRTIKLKIPKNIVELANKVYDEDNYEPLTKKEIALVLSNFYDNYGYFRREEKLCVQLFARCMKDNINCETLIDAFNKYCKVSAYFNYVPEMDGGEFINEKDPFAGFGIKVENTKEFYGTLKLLQDTKDLSF